MTLATQIFVGLGLGIATGLFFGEPMGALGVVGDAFIKLLQMTVMPYVMVSLIGGLGRLDYGGARSLALRGGLILVVLWGVAFCLVVAMPLAFPAVRTASFFSTTLVESTPPIDFVGLYIPHNPFHSMANNIVPAVVLFSIAVGVALIGMERKQRLIEPLETLAGALHRVSSFVVRLTPLGVFAIGASAAGTMSIQEFQRVQVYLVTYILFALALSFWVLPALVSVLTPIRYRDIVYVTRAPMVTAFATGSEFVVLPLLAERAKELLGRDAEEPTEAGSLVDVIVPIAYSFPHVGKVLSLSFVPFAAWFAGIDLPLWEYPGLGLTGIVTVFGSINVAMPFLLDLMRIPTDLFQLFLATGVLNARFGTLAGAMHILTLTLLVTCALVGGFALRWKRVVRFALVTLLLIAGVVAGARLAFATWIDTTYRKGEILAEMQLLRDTVPAVLHREPTPAPPLGPDKSRLESIVQRGVLRVCYNAAGKLPFAFFNHRGELVGLDIEMAHSLARGTGVTLEFVPIEGTFRGRRQAEALDSGYCDISMSRTALSMTQSPQVNYSDPYLDLTFGFIVRDHRRGEFARRGVLQARDDLRIAIPNDPYYVTRMQRLLPQAELVRVTAVREFLDADEGEFDAMLYLAEIGSAWTLLRPEFTVVVPEPPLQQVPLSYPLPLGELDWLNSVNSWVELKKHDGTLDQLYDYWILGREAERRGPRWSVIRDVLHWVD